MDDQLKKALELLSKYESLFERQKEIIELLRGQLAGFISKIDEISRKHK